MPSLLDNANPLKNFRWEAHATRYIFLMLGIAFSIWAALVPYAKERLQISEAELGFLLLLIGTGALLSMPWAGWLTNKLGCRQTLLTSSTVFLLSLIALAFISEIHLFGLTLLLFGISSGVIDIAMNMHAAILENFHKKKMMSGFHAMYSIGGFVGALITSIILKTGISSFTATAILSTLMLFGLFCIFRQHILPQGNHENTHQKLSRPSGTVIFMAILCFIFYMSDGVILDWGALLMKSKGSSLELSGLAFSLFSIAIASGRMLGDRIIGKIAIRKTLLTSALVTFLGYLTILQTPTAYFSLIGFTIVGLGVSNLIPILFSFASSQKTMPVSQAFSLITTLGYLGLMAGPPAMGFIAEYFGLQIVFLSIAVLTLTGALSAVRFLR